MNFNNLFNMQGMLFAVMLLGLFLRKKGMITDEGKALLTDLVIDVTLPASILKAFQIEFSMDILKSCIVIFILAIVIQIFSWALDLYCIRALTRSIRKCFSMLPSVLMQESWEIRSQKESSVPWDFCMHLFI